ncbi:MAG: hypothetical protein KDD50_00460 [Bdellovibrionales bacterium]|nr:hypothetical protein [Bdellovibrionales bacterium]
MDIKQKIEEYRAKDIHQVKLAIVDIDGLLRGKYISLEKFESMVNGLGGFCDCVFGWDIHDSLYDNAEFTGWHTAYPDALYKIDLNSERMIPGENVPFYLADFVANDGQSMHPVCPRNAFKRVLNKAEQMGFGVNLSFEYEFFLFNETPQSVREKHYQNLEPFTPGMCGYSILRNSTYGDLFNEFLNYCREFNIPIEGLHCESGPGVWEAAIKYDEALESADKAVLFKTFAKVFFQQRGLMATFMARWNLKYPGQSGHIHQSLYDLESQKPLFFNGSNKYRMSDLMKHYVAGQMKYLQPMLALTSPTINSYTRLVKGFWAPTAMTWGVENRTTALRVIPGNEKSQRIEYRVGSADANPYLAAAAVVGAGLLGIEQKLELDDALHGNAYEVQDMMPDEKQFPSNLRDSVANLKRFPLAKELLGDEFVEHFVSSRMWEVREHEKAITDWQLERYFELI